MSRTKRDIPSSALQTRIGTLSTTSVADCRAEEGYLTFKPRVERNVFRQTIVVVHYAYPIRFVNAPRMLPPAGTPAK
jgi:hypothetical protein